MKTYSYVGPHSIRQRVEKSTGGVIIHRPDDVQSWMQNTDQDLYDGAVVATYIISRDHLLRIADRHSEHVACAAGQPVLSAGEITFSIEPPFEVLEISNQSTGYCPEPHSWPTVEKALNLANITHPGCFTRICEFRRCPSCLAIALIKDGDFTCSICQTDLPADYNF